MRRTSKEAGACVFCGQSARKKRECKEFLSRKNTGNGDDKKKKKIKSKQAEKVKQVRENETRSFTSMVMLVDMTVVVMLAS